MSNDLLTYKICGQYPGGVSTPLHKPYRYVPPQRVKFLGLSGLKTGKNVGHFVPESALVFKETTAAYA